MADKNATLKLPDGKTLEFPVLEQAIRRSILRFEPRIDEKTLEVKITNDLASGLLEADYIVVEMARRLLGPSWLEDYVARANTGGIERVLV